MAGVVAALYVVLTLALVPLSYGPVQLRVANLLKPLALFNPAMAPAFALGTALANLASPFGLWDWIAMPLVDGLAAGLVWTLRKRPWVALLLQSAIISAGVALFPLWRGGGLSPLVTFLPVLAGQLISIVGGYVLIWRKRAELTEAL